MSDSKGGKKAPQASKKSAGDGAADQGKLELLKSLRLLENIPIEKLRDLTKFLQTCEFADGDVVFDEGSKGDSLYFIAGGIVRILKKGGDIEGNVTYKELAVLGAGDCFGEMTLFEEAPRSARAAASGDAVLLRLGRKELQEWLKSNPSLAVGFFTELTHVLSKRLRRSSSELSLLSDLSRWLLEPIPTGKELLQKILQHLVPHLEGSWSAGAYLYNEFNNEMENVAVSGPDAEAARRPVSLRGAPANEWLDAATYLAPLPGKERLQGYLIFHSAVALSREDQNEIGRTLTTVSRLISSALENIGFRTEDSLRRRLSSSRHYASGF